MNRHLDVELQDLKQLILKMGGCVEKAVDEATGAIIKRESKRFQSVYDYEARINNLHIDVDHACFELLAKQAPVARDLRLILAVVKINTDLERMGDQAVNISHSGADYLRRPSVNISADLSQMASEVQRMVKDALDSFVRYDVTLAKNVIERDDVIDQFKERMFDYLQNLMASNKTLIEPCMDLILIARNLERLADHATNVCEEVIFLTTGDDVRHIHRSRATKATKEEA